MHVIFVLLVTGVWFAEGSELINENQEVATSLSQSRTPDALTTIDCSRGEFHPHPTDCGKFVQCWNGNAYVKACAKSLHYNAEDHVCDHPCRAHCDANLVEECGWSKTVTLFPGTRVINQDAVSPVEKFIPNKDDCTTFYVYSSFGNFLMRCPPDLHFSIERERCMFPCEAKCDRNLDCNSASRKSEFDCPSDDGRYGDPYDCSIYHECSSFIHKIKRCKSGKYFDNERRRCTGRKSARCLYQCQKRKGRFPHPKQCDKFIHCRNSKAVVKSCPAGKAFEANKQECIGIGETDCGKNDLLDILEFSGSIELSQ